MSLFDKLTQSRGASLTSKQALSIFGISGDSVNVTDQTAMTHTTVYACVNVKAQGLSSVPFTLYRETDNGREKAKNHPLYKILGKQVNPLMTSVTWREMIVQDIELRGTHYSQIVRNGAGQIVAIYPLVHDNMQVDLSVNSKNIPTIKYKYTPQENGMAKNYSQNQIL